MFLKGHLLTSTFLRSADDGTGANQTDPNGGTPPPAGGGTDTQNGGKGDGDGQGSSDGGAPDLFAELEGDTREWLQKSNLNDPKEIAKKAHEQAKLLGNAIRLPGKNATPEEKAEFLNKLGRPEAPDGYEFAVPKDLPEEIPYDGERAAGFKAKAHELGLTKDQAAAMHDWFIGETVNDFKAGAEKSVKELAATAEVETGKLTKLWGPLDGPQAAANLELADRFVLNAGGEEAWSELERIGAVKSITVGDKTHKVVTSAVLAQMFANAGAALYKEGEVLRGNADRLDNPFADKSFNLTSAMKLAKEDPEQAKSLIAAAGKTPKDFGISA